MKKIFLVVLLAVPLIAWGVDKFLDYKFNENVTITISNIPCKVPAIDKNKFPFAVVAKRIDGQFLFGCFGHTGDTIDIQWAGGGDQTHLPASVFLEPNT